MKKDFWVFDTDGKLKGEFANIAEATNNAIPGDDIRNVCTSERWNVASDAIDANFKLAVKNRA